MYEYRATLISAHDGDTITVRVDLGFDLHWDGMILRLYGINAPELATPEGKTALAFAQQWLGTRPTFTIQTVKDRQEKYGRYLATVIDSTGASLNRALIDTSNAIPYLVPDGYWTTHT